MSKILLEKANAKLHENKLKRNTIGSGYHDDDLFCDKPCAPQHVPDSHDPTETAGHKRLGRRLPAIDQCIVPFHGKRTVKFVGPCAEKALAALQSFATKYTPKSPIGWADMVPSTRKAVCEIGELKVIQSDGVPMLSIWRDTWNDILSALYYEGVGLTGLPDYTEC